MSEAQREQQRAHVRKWAATAKGKRARERARRKYQRTAKGRAASKAAKAKQPAAKAAALHRRWAAEHPAAAAAYVAVRRALRRGELVRPGLCFVCRRACKPAAHHESYAAPLVILWACHACHRALHAGGGS